MENAVAVASVWTVDDGDEDDGAKFAMSGGPRTVAVATVADSASSAKATEINFERNDVPAGLGEESSGGMTGGGAEVSGLAFPPSVPVGDGATFVSVEDGAGLGVETSVEDDAALASAEEPVEEESGVELAATSGTTTSEEEAFASGELAPLTAEFSGGDSAEGGVPEGASPTRQTSVSPTFVMVPDVAKPVGKNPPQKICVPGI